MGKRVLACNKQQQQQAAGVFSPSGAWGQLQRTNCLQHGPCRTLAIIWKSTMLCVLLSCRYVQEFDEKNPATYKGLNLYNMPMSALYAHFGLDAQTIDFIGHALALHRCAAWDEATVLLLLS